MNNLMEIIHYATRAPSGHNSQPWKFKIEENCIEIHPDFDFALPVVDPFHRELYISIGCAAENLLVAANAFEYRSDWRIGTSEKGTYFIQIHLEESNNNPDKTVLQTIEKRQTNRSVFNKKTVNEDLLNQLKSISKENTINAYYFKNGDAHFSTLKKFILKGNEIQMKDSSFKNELLSWIRFNKKHIKKTKNGLTYKVMGSPATPKFIGKRIVSLFLTPTQQNKSDTKKIESSSHFILLTTKSNLPKEWILLGMHLEKIVLKTTELGIANAYLNPPCEIEPLASALQKELPINNEFPTIIMRIGYAEKAPFSPRKEPENVII